MNKEKGYIVVPLQIRYVNKPHLVKPIQPCEVNQENTRRKDTVPEIGIALRNERKAERMKRNPFLGLGPQISSEII